MTLGWGDHNNNENSHLHNYVESSTLSRGCMCLYTLWGSGKGRGK